VPFFQHALWLMIAMAGVITDASITALMVIADVPTFNDETLLSKLIKNVLNFLILFQTIHEYFNEIMSLYLKTSARKLCYCGFKSLGQIIPGANFKINTTFHVEHIRNRHGIIYNET
jgi:hypothetical protein